MPSGCCNFSDTPNAKIMDGGRLKWIKENRPVTRDVPKYQPSNYQAPERDDTQFRAFRDQTLKHLERKLPMIDVRSPEEYRGERLHMPEYPNEGALRGGHIPGALNIPWGRAVNQEDGTFKDAAELRKIYTEENKLRPEDDVIAYCRIGERSSHTWFVLRYLLGFSKSGITTVAGRSGETSSRCRLRTRAQRREMKLLPEQLERLLSTLETLDRGDRIQMLIELAGQFKPVPPRIAQRPLSGRAPRSGM